MPSAQWSALKNMKIAIYGLSKESVGVWWCAIKIIFKKPIILLYTEQNIWEEGNNVILRYLSITVWKFLSEVWAMSYLFFSFFCKKPYNLEFQEDILIVSAVSR